jgi:hypothetical protein
VWLALGYESWPDYIKGEFRHAPLAMPRDERRAVVALLRGQGMSTRTIAAATGLGKDTVHRELSGVANETPEPGDVIDVEPAPRPAPVPIIGLDGKTYQPKPVEPKPRRRQPITEAFYSTKRDLGRAVERVVRLSVDDRFEKNKAQITDINLSDLIRARDGINAVIGLLSPAHFVSDSASDEMDDFFAMADVSPDQFEEVLAEARSEGDMSRANVARKSRAKALPTAR